MVFLTFHIVSRLFFFSVLCISIQAWVENILRTICTEGVSTVVLFTLGWTAKVKMKSESPPLPPPPDPPKHCGKPDCFLAGIVDG